MRSDKIFNCDKLPKDVKSNLRLRPNIRGFKGRILDLFLLKDSISINDIIVGLYNKNKEKCSRAKVSSTLSSLKEKGHIERVGPGIYKRK